MCDIAINLFRITLSIIYILNIWITKDLELDGLVLTSHQYAENNLYNIYSLSTDDDPYRDSNMNLSFFPFFLLNY